MNKLFTIEEFKDWVRKAKGTFLKVRSDKLLLKYAKDIYSNGTKSAIAMLILNLENLVYDSNVFDDTYQAVYDNDQADDLLTGNYTSDEIYDIFLTMDSEETHYLIEPIVPIEQDVPSESLNDA